MGGDVMAPVTSIGASAHESIRGAVNDSRRSMGFEPVFQGKIDAGLPTLTAVTERTEHIRAETDRDAFLGGSFVRAAPAPKLGLQ